MSYTNGLDKPTDYFNTKLYTGDGNTTQSITGVSFQPDFTWLKNRDSTDYHRLVDSVRGATKTVYSNDAQIEVTNDSNGYIASFDTDGLTVNKASGNGTNTSGNKYVTWNWLAGGTASSNTDGSITSSVSANTTAGFSIVSWTETTANSQTIGHGLGKTPAMIITKLRDDSALDWYTFHQSLGTGNRVMLNSTSAKVSSGFFNGTLDNSVFHVGYGDSYDNKSAIAYCFAEIKGYSKFGSYTGNGNSDGTFVYTGFKPAFVMIKQTDTTRSWHIYDSVRSPSNQVNVYLAPDQSQGESPAFINNNQFDFLSNGFKLRSTNTGSNDTSGTYIYMAFAESPFVTGDSGIPTTAR